MVVIKNKFKYLLRYPVDDNYAEYIEAGTVFKIVCMDRSSIFLQPIYESLEHPIMVVPEMLKIGFTESKAKESTRSQLIIRKELTCN